MKGERHCHRRMGREEISHRVFLQNKRASSVYQPPRRLLTQDPNRRYIRKVSFAAELIRLAGGLYGCMLAIIWGVSQNGRDHSCISTTLSWLPTSAPGPPPRVRVASGLSQAARAVSAISSIVRLSFISHSSAEKTTTRRRNEAAYQTKLQPWLSSGSRANASQVKRQRQSSTPRTPTG